MTRAALLGFLLLLCSMVPADPQGTNTNPVPGNVWTYLGSTYGAAWAPITQPSGGVSATQFGADPSGVKDSTAAFNQALSTGQSPIYVPPGTYSISALTLSNTGQQIVCASPRSTRLAQNTTSGDFITMTGLWNGVIGCFFEPNVRVTGTQVVFAASCYHCFLRDFEMAYAYNGISVAASGVSVGSASTWDIIGSTTGHYAILFQGTSSSQQASGLNITNVLVNNAYQVNGGYGQEVVTWATNTAYVAGNITFVNGAIYQEQTATCTSAASGSGPSGMPPGTALGTIFTTTIPDGTCNWYFVNNGLLGFINNSWGNSAQLIGFTVLNNYECIKLQDTNNPGTLSEPHYDMFIRPSCDHNFNVGIDMEAGYDVEISNPYVGSTFQSDGILFGGSFTAIGTVIGGRVADNWQHGIQIAKGTNFVISGVNAGSNSQQQAGLFNNISVNPGISGGNITNNMVGNDAEAAPTPKTYAGVLLGAGAGDYWTVTGNICQGNYTGPACFDNGASGSHIYAPAGSNN